MIHPKCKDCDALIIPYKFMHRNGHKIPSFDWVGTCKCNMDLLDRWEEGFYGWCHPDLCQGAGHNYVLAEDKLKFL